MYIQYFFIFFITVFRITNSFEFSYSKFNSLLHEKEIKNCFHKLFNNNINNDINNNIKIVNNINENMNWFLDLFDIYCKNENINYNKVSYYNFFNDKYIEKEYNIIEDFMINYGRTLNQFEKDKIGVKNIKYKKINLIMHVQDYNNLILKDNEFINTFETIEFPEIDKRLINNYIMNMVDYYNYHNDILLINWKKYDICKLDIRKIENLIFKIHNLMILSDKNNKNNKKFDNMYYENFLNKELKYLDTKYYDK